METSKVSFCICTSLSFTSQISYQWMIVKKACLQLVVSTYVVNASVNLRYDEQKGAWASIAADTALR